MQNIKNLLSNWYITYNPYSDIFQIYDNNAFTTPKEKMLKNGEGKICVWIDKQSSDPILLEIKNAYDVLGVDIDSLKKTDIIDIVEPYIRQYGAI